MPSRLFTIASALSLLLCMAMLALFARSDGRRHELDFPWPRARYALAFERGELLIENSPEIGNHLADINALYAESQALYNQWMRSGWTDDQAKWLSADQRLRFVSGKMPSAIRYAVPDWLLALLALILPLAWAWKWSQQRPRAAIGLCPQCGYDLRATTGRCPECGTPMPSARRTWAG